MKTYQGTDVRTEGKGRFTRVTINGREVWARAVRARGAYKRLVSDYRVDVLGWGSEAVIFEQLPAAARKALLTTLD